MKSIVLSRTALMLYSIITLAVINVLSACAIIATKHGTLDGHDRVNTMLTLIICAIVVLYCASRENIMNSRKLLLFLVSNMASTVVSLTSFILGWDTIAIILWTFSSFSVVWIIVERMERRT